MKIIGNLLWWLFGGLEAAIGYFTGSLALAITIIGIPFALQTFKIGLLCLWPFGAEIRRTEGPGGCIRIPMNIIWIVFGGLCSGYSSRASRDAPITLSIRESTASRPRPSADEVTIMSPVPMRSAEAITPTALPHAARESLSACC